MPPPVVIPFLSTSAEHQNFSNFALWKVVVDNKEYPSSEHCYVDKKVRFFGREIGALMKLTPKLAKRAGDEVRLSSPASAVDAWNCVKGDVMFRIVLCKFEQHDELRRELLQTEDSILAECAFNTYWGSGESEEETRKGRYRGRNMMGKILMNVRQILGMSDFRLNSDDFPPLPKSEHASAAVKLGEGTSQACVVQEPEKGKVAEKAVEVKVAGEEEEENKEREIGEEERKKEEEEKEIEEILGAFGNEGFGSKNKDSGESEEDFRARASPEELARSFGKMELDSFGKQKFSEDKIVGEKSVIYLVCQVEENTVVAARLKSMNDKGWPFFVSISSELSDRHASRGLQLGDMVGVVRYVWKEEFRVLAARESEKSAHRKMWYTHHINSQANATQLSLVTLAPRKEFPGVVLRIRDMVTATGETKRLGAIVISPGLQMSARCFRRQLIGLDLGKLEVGQLVKVWAATLPEGCLVSDSYVLPPQPLFKMGSENWVLGGMGALAGVEAGEPWRFQREGKNVFYPLSPEMTSEEESFALRIMGSAVAYSFEEEIKSSLESRFEGSVVVSGVDDLFWRLRFCGIDSVKVKKLKEVWEEDEQVQAKTALDIPHFAQGVVKSVEVEEVRSFGKPKFDMSVEVKMQRPQERKKQDTETEFDRACRGGFVVIHPVVSKGQWDRRMCFASAQPAEVAKLNTAQGEIMRALLGRKSERAVVIDEEVIEGDQQAERPRGNRFFERLNEQQRASAELLLESGGRLIFQQAPPGVGKTLVAVTAASSLIENQSEKVAIVTAANLPLANLASVLEEVLGEEEMLASGSLALFSGYAKDRYRLVLERLRQYMLVSKVKSEEVISKIDKGDRKLFDEYCKDFEVRPRLTNERRIATLVSQVEDDRVVFATANLAEDLCNTSLRGTTALIFDEATQGSWVQLVHLVANLPELKRVFVTGDRFQLGVHLQKLPALLQSGFGLESMVDQLVVSARVRQTRLKVCYRMHPILVEAVSYAAYEPNGEVLEPGTQASSRTLLTESPFPLPMQDSPILLLNVGGTCRQDPSSYSLTNDRQTASAVQVSSSLRSNCPEASLVVICMYTFQKECVQRELMSVGLSDVLVVSVDGYQAQEADIVIVVTTRSKAREGTLGESSEFLKDSRRATVALSRARHGLVLIGDLDVLREGSVWGRFLEKASEGTPMVGYGFFEVLKVGGFKRDRFGQLISADGRLVSEMAAGGSGRVALAGRDETWRPGGKRPAARDEDWRAGPKVWTPRGSATTGRGAITCYECGKQGHIARSCPESRGSAAVGRGVKCYQCGGFGHFARDCEGSSSGHHDGRGNGGWKRRRGM